MPTPPFYRSAIAHSIREQAYTYAKSLLLVDHKFDGKPVTEDEELAAALLPPLFIDNNSDVTATTSTVDPQKATTTADPNVRRGDKDALITGPYVEHVNDKSIQELDKELEREAR